MEPSASDMSSQRVEISLLTHYIHSIHSLCSLKISYSDYYKFVQRTDRSPYNQALTRPCTSRL